MLQDHAGFSEVQPILFAQQREEIPCSKKFLAALPLAKDFHGHMNSEMCSKGAWKKSEGFAFTGRCCLVRNLSKTPVVVNGEQQDPRGDGTHLTCLRHQS